MRLWDDYTAFLESLPDPPKKGPAPEVRRKDSPEKQARKNAARKKKYHEDAEFRAAEKKRAREYNGPPLSPELRSEVARRREAAKTKEEKALARMEGWMTRYGSTN